jgi:hypothetical protein
MEERDGLDASDVLAMVQYALSGAAAVIGWMWLNGRF